MSQEDNFEKSIIKIEKLKECVETESFYFYNFYKNLFVFYNEDKTKRLMFETVYGSNITQSMTLANIKKEARNLKTNFNTI